MLSEDISCQYDVYVVLAATSHNIIRIRHMIAHKTQDTYTSNQPITRWALTSRSL